MELRRNRGLYARAARHPFLTSGAALLGAGVGYAVYRVVTNWSKPEVAKEVHVETSIAVNKTPAELYAIWRNFGNLPLFMKNLVSVTDSGDGRSHWVAKTINGSRIEWDAEIYNEKKNELIAWRSLENSDVVNAGSVRFEQGPQGRGAFVRVTMNYNPPVGKAGEAVAELFHIDGAHLIKEDLRRFKQFVETGEIASITGQTSGRAEIAQPSTDLSPEAAATEKARGQRA